MISLTLNSKKGTDNTNYPDSSILTNVVNSAAVAANGTSFTMSPSNFLVKIGDTFTYPITSAPNTLISTFSGTVPNSSTTLTLTTTATGLTVPAFLYFGSTMIAKITTLVTGTLGAIGSTYTLSQTLYDFANSTVFSTYSNAVYNIYNVTSTVINFYPSSFDGFANASIMPVTTIHSSTFGQTTKSALLGYKVGAATCTTYPIGTNVLDISNPPFFFSNSAVNSTCSLIIERVISGYRFKDIRDTYSISNLTYNYLNKTSSLVIPSTGLTRQVNAAQNTLHFYSRTYNTVSYTIDTTIFNVGKKYELSFSFSSYPCILNQGARIPLVYVNLGSDKTYDNNGTFMSQSNFLGFLKTNNFYNSIATIAETVGNVSYSKLVADPANIPIIISKPVTNTINIQILNEDGTPFVDNSNIGIMPPYVITLYFKEID